MKSTTRTIKNWVKVPTGVVVLLAAGGVMTGDLKSPWTQHDKAYYLDNNAASFYRPGLITKILDAQIAADGTITTRVKITDRAGTAIDRLGIDTPGVVNLSFIAGYIPAGQTQYVSYTTRVQTSPINNRSATQAVADNPAGTFEKVAEGEYRYTFRTRAPQSIDRTATHSVGVYSNRNMNEFDLGVHYDDDVFTFVPAGGQPRTTRDVIRTETCNKCHDPLGEHGGSRKSMELCVMCHTPQTVDPDTGNTVDLPVMVHKLHMGRDLPSVKAGTPYRIIGNAQSVNDYSTVVFPPGVNNCTVCHQGGATPASTPAQVDAWLKPSRAACGSCHEDVNFATGAGHATGLVQTTDNQCANCHTPQGENDFDASIRGAHLTARFSSNLPGTVFKIERVEDGSAGRRPTVVFSIKDKAGKPLLPSEMTRLALVLAGPTSDYASFVSEDALRAQAGGDGNAVWTFQQPIPANARGSFSVGIEGYRNVKLLEGTRQEVTVRDAGVNQVLTFSVDGSRVQPRRTIVSLAKCNNCHNSLSLHGDNRNTIEMCVLCHNPNQTDSARRPAAEGVAETVDFRTMIHKIHTGEELTRGFTLFGFGSAKFDFAEVRYPGDRRNCSACHVNGSENLPLREGLLPVNTPRGLLNPTPPETASCVGCHDSRAAVAHAAGNVNAVGESCAVCHGPNADFAVSRVHAR